MEKRERSLQSNYTCHTHKPDSDESVGRQVPSCRFSVLPLHICILLRPLFITDIAHALLVLVPSKVLKMCATLDSLAVRNAVKRGGKGLRCSDRAYV
jgi:hypothetical protein